jgi:hypothetical protein
LFFGFSIDLVSSSPLDIGSSSAFLPAFVTLLISSLVVIFCEEAVCERRVLGVIYYTVFEALLRNVRFGAAIILLLADLLAEFTI